MPQVCAVRILLAERLGPAWVRSNGGPTYWSGAGQGHGGLGEGCPSCDTYPIPGGDGHPPSMGYNYGGGANNWPCASTLLPARLQPACVFSSVLSAKSARVVSCLS